MKRETVSLARLSKGSLPSEPWRLGPFLRSELPPHPVHDVGFSAGFEIRDALEQAKALALPEGAAAGVFVEHGDQQPCCVAGPCGCGQMVEESAAEAHATAVLIDQQQPDIGVVGFRVAEGHVGDRDKRST